MRIEGPLYAAVMLFLALLLGGVVGVIVYAWWAEITEWRRKYVEEADTDL